MSGPHDALDDDGHGLFLEAVLRRTQERPRFPPERRGIYPLDGVDELCQPCCRVGGIVWQEPGPVHPCQGLLWRVLEQRGRPHGQWGAYHRDDALEGFDDVRRQRRREDATKCLRFVLAL